MLEVGGCLQNLLHAGAIQDVRSDVRLAALGQRELHCGALQQVLIETPVGADTHIERSPRQLTVRSQAGQVRLYLCQRQCLGGSPAIRLHEIHHRVLVEFFRRLRKSAQHHVLPEQLSHFAHD